MKTNGTEVAVQEGKSPSALIEFALEKGADLGKLEQLLTIRERFESGEARKAFNKAMSDFKANAPKIVKDKAVSFGQGKAAYKHATLFQVAEKIAAVMSKYGLSASWRVDQTNDIAVTTRVVHEQGHFEETTLRAPSDTSGSKNPIQAIGSTISYLQRYGLLCIAGLATADMDDDGNSYGMEYITESQLADLVSLMQEVKADPKLFLKFMDIASLDKMPKAKYQKAIAGLESKRVQKPAMVAK